MLEKRTLQSIFSTKQRESNNKLKIISVNRVKKE